MPPWVNSFAAESIQSERPAVLGRIKDAIRYGVRRTAARQRVGGRHGGSVTMARTRRWAGMVVAVWVMGTLLAGAQAPERLSDLDVKRLITDLAKSRDAFEAQLDDSAKNAVITGPRGDVRVREYLDQFKQSVDNVKNRFTEQYSANSEAQTVLRQGTDIQ